MKFPIKFIDQIFHYSMNSELTLNVSQNYSDLQRETFITICFHCHHKVKRF